MKYKIQVASYDCNNQCFYKYTKYDFKKDEILSFNSYEEAKKFIDKYIYEFIEHILRWPDHPVNIYEFNIIENKKIIKYRKIRLFGDPIVEHIV